MDKIKLIIADPDTLFTDYAVSALKVYPEIEILSVVNNGLDALQKIKQFQPDVLLFDLLLPGLDGISLLKNISEMKNPPVTLCCTRFFSDVALEAILSFGVAYTLYKPVDAQALQTSIVSSLRMHKRISSYKNSMIAANVDNDRLRMYIRNYIITLGIPSKLVGCTYLTEAVLLAKGDMMLMRNLSRGLYLEISRIMRTTPSCVERSIRSAISAAYASHNLPGTFLQCPSNKEFIRYILQYLSI